MDMKIEEAKKVLATNSMNTIFITRLDNPHRAADVYSNVRIFISELRKSSIGLIVYAGADSKVSERLYKDFDIVIDKAYKTTNSRETPEGFNDAKKMMLYDGFDPIAYLTNKPIHAEAARDAWGKALLCTTDAESLMYGQTHKLDPNSRIYVFDWQELNQERIQKIIDFLNSE